MQTHMLRGAILAAAAIFGICQASACALDIDAKRLNDNYCDCSDDTDDEPQTGACGVGFFYCTTLQVLISSAFVGDGVCDCCDGSDEPANISCANTCEDDKAKATKRLQHVLDQVQQGLQVKKEYVAYGASQQWRDEIAQGVDQWEDLAEEAEDREDEFTHHFQINKIKPTEEHKNIYRYLHAQVVKAQIQLHSYRQLASSTFGEENEYAALIGQCFDYEVNEKQLKGGTSNTVARTYLMRFCPFANVTQTEPKYGAWRRAQGEAQMGDHYVPLPSDSEEVQEPILLGLWDQWVTLNIDLTPLDVPTIVPFELYKETPLVAIERDPTPRVVQAYSHGDACLNQKRRQVFVQMECAAYNHIVYMEERAVCEYTIGFGTPAACSTVYASHLEVVLGRTAVHDEL
ncbi:unnamed protein product [Aphanomyces euteiches]